MSFSLQAMTVVPLYSIRLNWSVQTRCLGLPVRSPTSSQRLSSSPYPLAPSPSSHSQPYDDPSCSVPSQALCFLYLSGHPTAIHLVFLRSSYPGYCYKPTIALGKDTATMDYRANVSSIIYGQITLYEPRVLHFSAFHM